MTQTPETLSGQPPTSSPVVNSVTVSAPVAEPGYTTTEFWVAVFGNGVSFLTAFNIIHFTSSQAQVIGGLATMAATNIAYAISRGIRKSGTTG